MAAKAVLVGGISLLRSFSSLALHTVVVTRNTGDAVRYSRDANESFVVADPVTSPDLVVDKLIDIAKDMAEQPVLFYGDDVMMLLISRNRNKLLKYYRFLMPDEELIEACADKQQFDKLARNHKLPVPATINAGQVNDCNDLGNSISFPVIVKPLLSTGKLDVARLSNGMPQKVLLVNSSEELHKVMHNIKDKEKDFAIQKYIAGGEEEIYSYHTFADENCNPIACYVGKKIRTYPSIGGISTYVELVKNPDILQLGNKIVSALKVKCPVKIDFKKDINQQDYYLLELNLRFNLWNYLGAKCGINLADIAYKHSCNIPYTVNHEYKTGIRWLSFGDDFRAYRQCYGPAGELTLSGWACSLLAPKVYHIFSWRDPLPWAIKLTRLWLRSIKRKLIRNK